MSDENKLLHQRLRRTKGSASAHNCCDCGSQAHEWAYQHTDPKPRTDSKGQLYSPDMVHYKPMCRSCHRFLDYKMNPEAKAKKADQLRETVGDSNEMRRRGLLANRNKKHESSCSRRMATREGVVRCPCGARRED